MSAVPEAIPVRFQCGREPIDTIDTNQTIYLSCRILYPTSIVKSSRNAFMSMRLDKAVEVCRVFLRSSNHPQLLFHGGTRDA